MRAFEMVKINEPQILKYFGCWWLDVFEGQPVIALEDHIYHKREQFHGWKWIPRFLVVHETELQVSSS